MSWLAGACVSVAATAMIAFIVWHLVQAAMAPRRRRRRREASALLARALATGDLDMFVEQRGGPSEELVRAALRLGSQLTGSDRELVAEMLRRSGVRERALAQIGSRSATVRARGTELVAWVSEPRDTGLLSDLLHDRDEEVRLLAARGLSRRAPAEASRPLFAAVAEGRLPPTVAAACLDRLDGIPIGVIARNLSHPAAAVRRTAAVLAGRDQLFPLGAVLATLVDHDPAPAVRRSAARSLARLGLPGTLAGLDRALQTETRPEVVLAVVEAMARLDTPAAWAALERRSADRRTMVASSARAAIAHRHGEAGELVRA